MALTSAKKALQQAARDTGWIPVVSSNLKAIRHMGAPDNRLFVQFKDGGQGFYADVPRAVFNQMRAVGSKGKFLHRRLKNTYSWTAT